MSIQTLITFLMLAVPTLVQAQQPDPAGGLGPAAVPTGTIDTDLVSALETLINGFLILIGVIAAGFLIWGGVRYIISLGQEENIAKAKRTIIYAIIGLIIIGLAAAIANFTIETIGGG